MDKRTIIGFVLIFVSILFFQSEFYYNKVLGKKHPNQVAAEKRKAQELEQKQQDSLAAIAATEEASKKKAPALTEAPEKDSVLTTAMDTAAQTAPQNYRPVIIETPDYICTVSRKGARITSFKLKNYKPKKPGSSDEMAEMIPQDRIGVLNAEFNGKKLDNLAFVCSELDSTDTLETISENDSLQLSFVNTDENGGQIIKQFLFRGNDWRIGLSLKKKNMGMGNLKLGWNGGINAIDEDPVKKGKARSGPGGYEGHLLWGEDVEQADDFENGKKEYPGLVRWISVKEGYFGGALILKQSRDATVEFQQEIKNKIPVQTTFHLVEDFDNDLEYNVFIGPMKHALLKSFNNQMQGIIFQGYSWFFKADIWFPKLCGFVLWLLNYFYSIIADYGVAIMLLTIVSRVVMIPLTLKSQKSMGAMKELQPKMQEIRAKYKSDPVKMNKEVMALYKKNNISPLGGAGGCLPMFLQMPVFLSLFVALRKAIELRGADTFLPWISDLSQPDVILSLPFEIPFYGAHVCLLPILMSVATFFQNKMMMKDPNQKMMVYMMPVFFLFLFNSFPAGLNLYWTLSTVIGIIQQVIVEANKKKKAV